MMFDKVDLVVAVHHRSVVHPLVDGLCHLVIRYQSGSNTLQSRYLQRAKGGLSHFRVVVLLFHGGLHESLFTKSAQGSLLLFTMGCGNERGRQ